jgi:peptidoglycan/LPS O-acetylase OafA/YrhL
MALAIFLNKFAVNKIPFITYLGIFVVIVLVFALSILSFSIHSRFDKIIIKIIDLILLPTLGFAPLIIGLIYNRTYISKMLTTPLFQILGKSSYVFYLIHMGIVVHVLHKIFTNYTFLFISVNIIAIIMYMFLESPINKYIRNRFSSTK